VEDEKSGGREKGSEWNRSEAKTWGKKYGKAKKMMIIKYDWRREVHSRGWSRKYKVYERKRGKEIKKKIWISWEENFELKEN
jgi:hypothetical protein